MFLAIKFNFMKTLFTLVFTSMIALTAFAQNKAVSAPKPDPAKKLQIVEAACGQCQLGLDGKSCDLAVRINGKAYFVDGTDIESHGDAHAKDGFCNSIRKAEIQGAIVNNRFKVSYFKLVSSPKSGPGISAR